MSRIEVKLKLKQLFAVQQKVKRAFERGDEEGQVVLSRMADHLEEDLYRRRG